MTLHSPLAELIYNQLETLALTKPALVKRMGYGNVAKGLRRLNAVLQGDLRRVDPLFIDRLASALGLKLSALQDAISQTSVLQLNASFSPHAYLVTERVVPSPIFVCAWGNFHLLKYIWFPTDLSGNEYLEFAMKRLPVAIPTFGRVTGFRIHYSLEIANSFNLDGQINEALVCLPQVNLATLHI